MSLRYLLISTKNNKILLVILILVFVFSVIRISIPPVLRHLLFDDFQVTEITTSERLICCDNYIGTPVKTGPVNFLSPWGPVTKMSERDNKTSYQFAPDVTVVFQIEQEQYYSEGILNGYSRVERFQFEKMYGNDISHFELREIVLQATPEMLSFRNSVLKNWIIFSILRAKTFSLMHTAASEGLFSFNAPKVNGFQMGVPEALGYVKLEIYDNQSQMMLITVHGSITQEQIDCFVKYLGED